MEPPEWLHGEVRLDGDLLVLDTETATLYEPYSCEDLVFDLAGVETPEDAVRVASEYGLLRLGPEHDGDYRESVELWREESHSLRSALRLFSDLCQSVEGRLSFADLLDTWGPVFDELTEVFDEAMTLPELQAQLAELLSMLVTTRLRDVPQGVYAAHVVDDEAPRDAFLFGVAPDDLLGYAHQQLGQVVVSHGRIRACELCRKLFPVNDERQKYCSEQCSARVRSRRRYQRKKEKGL